MKKQTFLNFSIAAVIITLMLSNLNILGFVPAAEKWAFFVNGNAFGFIAKQMQEIFVPIIMSYVIYIMTNVDKITKEIKKYTLLAKKQNSKVPAPVVGAILGVVSFISE